MGWRTFRVTAAGSGREEGLAESVCPASAESKVARPITCAECGVCDGAESGRRGSIRIAVHGSLRKRFESATA
jgi:hypothetical protein